MLVIYLCEENRELYYKLVLKTFFLIDVGFVSRYLKALHKPTEMANDKKRIIQIIEYACDLQHAFVFLYMIKKHKLVSV